MESEARSAAAAAQAEAPRDDFFVYNTLGNAHQALRDFGKAIKFHTVPGDRVPHAVPGDTLAAFMGILQVDRLGAGAGFSK
jgi:hypothetical protein